jgi:hypothetical protein
MNEIFYLPHTSVLVTAPLCSYKQHILSPAEVRKVSNASGELKVRSLYLIYSGRGGLKFMKYFKGSGASYKIFGISRLQTVTTSLITQTHFY